VEPRFSSLLQGVSNTLAAAFGVIGMTKHTVESLTRGVAVPLSGVLYMAWGKSWVPVFLNIVLVYVIGALVFVAWARTDPVRLDTLRLPAHMLI